MANLSDLLQGASQAIVTRKLLGKVTVSGTLAEIDFDGLDQTFDRLYINGQIRTDRVASIDGVFIEFNGDTTPANYHWQRVRGQNGTSNTQEGNTAEAYTVSGANAIGNSFTAVESTIESYATSPANTQVYSRSSGYGGANSATWTNMVTQWNNSSAVTRVTLSSENGANFVTGTEIELFGEKEINVGGGNGSSQLEADSSNAEQQVIKFPTEDGTKMIIFGTTNNDPNPRVITWDEPFANTNYTFVAMNNAGTGSVVDRTVFESARTTDDITLIITFNGSASSAPVNYIAIGDATVDTRNIGGADSDNLLIAKDFALAPALDATFEDAGGSGSLAYANGRRAASGGSKFLRSVSGRAFDRPLTMETVIGAGSGALNALAIIFLNSTDANVAAQLIFAADGSVSGFDNAGTPFDTVAGIWQANDIYKITGTILPNELICRFAIEQISPNAIVTSSVRFFEFPLTNVDLTDEIKMQINLNADGQTVHEMQYYASVSRPVG